MAREVSIDLEGTSPAAGLLRPPPAASPIAQERAAPGRPGIGFVLGVLALGLATTAVCLGLGMRGEMVAAEQAAAGHPTGMADLGQVAGRTLSAVLAGLAVAGAAAAGRRITHSGPAGLLAGAIVAADPALLLQGSLAVPLAAELAALAWALAFASSPIPLLHWMSGLVLGFAAFFDPAAALWVLPLAAFLLLRGHIYAAPQHLALAMVQVAVFPAIGLLLHLGLEGSAGRVPACLALGPWDQATLLRLVQPAPGLLLVPDPVAWLAGAGSLLFMGLGGLAFGLASFRIARAPGRLQVRVVSPVPPALARGSWLLVLALAAPAVALPMLAAIALALGIRELGEDAPGFGVVLAVAVLTFAGLVLVRAWGGLTGAAGGVEEALSMVPWATAVSC